MPQFDPTYFFSQITWLVISFTLLYMIVAKWLMPKISATLVARIENIEGNIEKSEDMKNKAKDIIEEYHKIIDEAKKEAQLIAQKAYKKAVEQADRKKNQLKEDTEKMIKKVEEDIEKQKEKQKKDFEEEQIQLTQHMLKQIVNLPLEKVEKNEIKNIVKKVASEINN